VGVALLVRGAKQRAILAFLVLNREFRSRRSPHRPALGRQTDGEADQRLAGSDRSVASGHWASAIVTSESGYAIDMSSVDLDTVRFENLVAKVVACEARARWHGRQPFSLTRSDYGREPLSEFVYVTFADAERVRSTSTLVATEYRIEADLELGLHSDVVGELRALCRTTHFANAFGSCS